MRKKEKKLRPSMRENRRYLLLESSSKDSEKSDDSQTLSSKRLTRDNIEKAILDYIGILGFSKASPIFVEAGVLAVNREKLDEVKAGLLLAGIKVKRVSGTLAGLDN